MGSTAIRSDPALWERVKRLVTAGEKGGRKGQWSARKAQLAVQEYKRLGGGYAGPRRADNHLRQWTEDDAARKAGRHRRDGSGPTRAALMDEARRRGVKGFSRMDKAELRHALGR